MNRYGWHFPELGKIITDNLAYIRCVEVMGTRDNAKSMDLSDILPEEVNYWILLPLEMFMQIKEHCSFAVLDFKGWDSQFLPSYPDLQINLSEFKKNGN